MNKNREEKTICCRTTPMNLNQGTNKKSWKIHRSINHKGIQKCTSLNRNGVQVRDGPDKMTRNPEKQVMNLSKLMGSDARINTPLNGSNDKIWYNVIKRRGLRIRVDWLSYQRYPKSRGHYWTSNNILFTPYPTHHILDVGIIEVDREIRIELSNQGNQKRMRNVQQRQPTPTLKVPPNLLI